LKGEFERFVELIKKTKSFSI